MVGKDHRPARKNAPAKLRKAVSQQVLTYATVSHAAEKACAPVLPLHRHCSHGHFWQIVRKVKWKAGGFCSRCDGGNAPGTAGNQKQRHSRLLLL